MKENKKKKGRVKGFFKDFKAFITKGNILDLAIAVIIGGAFGKIVTSLVNDIIMPLISLLAGGKAVSDWKKVLTEAVYEDGVLVKAESAIYYGNFLQSVIDFLIIALFIFIALRVLMNIKNRLARKEEAVAADSLEPASIEPAPAPATASTEENESKENKETAEDLLRQIRDALQKQAE